MKTQKRFVSITSTLLLLFFTGSTNATPPETIQSLRELVEVSSGTENLVGVNQVQTLLGEKLKKLGFQIERLPGPEKRVGDFLVATRKGQSPSTITFVLHADTVFETSSGLLGFKTDPEGKKGFGPGVIDEKGGIVVALQALSRLLHDGMTPKYSLRVLSSPSEETGSNDFLENYKKWSMDTFLVLGFEPALDDGSIISSRRGNRWYDIRIKGRESHSGRAHREGINACLELSLKLASISALSDYSKDVTVSVGRIEGGQDKFNVVCGEAHAKVDTRFSDFQSGDRLHQRIEKILNHSQVHAASDHQPAKTTYTLANDCPAFSESPRSRKQIDSYLAAIEIEEGRKVKATHSGGGSDLNYFSRPGLTLIDGLGPVGGKMHTPEEFIWLDSLETRAKALAGFIENLD